MVRAGPGWTCAQCESVPVIASVWLCLSVNRPRDLATALALCHVCVPSEASRTLPSLESIQKVFEQQLHPGTHQRSQVRGLGGGKSRTGVWVAASGGKGWLWCAAMANGYRWAHATSVLFSLFLLQCRGHTVSSIPQFHISHSPPHLLPLPVLEESATNCLRTPTSPSSLRMWAGIAHFFFHKPHSRMFHCYILPFLKPI